MPFIGHLLSFIFYPILKLLAPSLQRWSKPSNPSLVLATLADLTRQPSELILENAFLRQQIIVLSRPEVRPSVLDSMHIRSDSVLNSPDAMRTPKKPHLSSKRIVFLLESWAKIVVWQPQKTGGYGLVHSHTVPFYRVGTHLSPQTNRRREGPRNPAVATAVGHSGAQVDEIAAGVSG